MKTKIKPLDMSMYIMHVCSRNTEDYFGTSAFNTRFPRVLSVLRFRPLAALQPRTEGLGTEVAKTPTASPRLLGYCSLLLRGPTAQQCQDSPGFTEPTKSTQTAHRWARRHKLEKARVAGNVPQQGNPDPENR